jgi:Na+/pantothenate symporter
MNTLSTRYRSFTARSAIAKRYNNNSMNLLAGLAMTFAMLALWLGLFWAMFTVAAAAILAVWAAPCRRWPLVRIFTAWAVFGFIQGLLDD